MAATLLTDFLETAADRDPDQVCLVEGPDRATYGQVAQGARQTARVLLSEGLGRGDRVALLAANSRFWVESYFGILLAGGVVVPINTAANGRLLGFFLRDAGARMLVLGAGSQRALRGGLDGLQQTLLLLTEGPQHYAGGLPPPIRLRDLQAAKVEVDDRPIDAGVTGRDVACIVYTSGSTGRPRGATLTHLNCVTNARAVVRYLRLTPADRVLAVLPFYYIYGKSVLDTHIVSGATVVIENRFLYPQKALDTLGQERCTGFSGVPSSFAILLNRSNFAERRFEHLRYVTQAGGPMSPALTRRLMAALPDQEIFIMYGATEAAGRLSYLPPADLPENVGTIGKAIDNVELRVLRSDGTACGVGEVGEIVARGPSIMQGYWQAPEETARVLDEHGYHTGDLGRLEASGYLSVVGRRRNMIKTGAHRVSPREIEDAILEHPGVHETAVIGVPDEVLGEAIRAYVVPKSPGERLEKLRGFLAPRLAPFKLPAKIEIRRQLPKNESGKIMKQALQDEAHRS